MEYTTLGRTGLKVSVAGLGCGGFSRLGLGTGKSEAEAIGIVHAALDTGVNLFDTAAAYSTEPVLGKALHNVPRDSVVICTKAPFTLSRPNSSAEQVVASLDQSLRDLGTDYIDVYQLHGVAPGAYDHAFEVMAPALLREKEKGKFRHLGITETAPNDPHHEMVRHACRDGIWDVMMVAFHMMHQNGRTAVFPLTREHGVGTLLMFAVRNIFSRPERLAATMRELAAAGELPAALAENPDPLGFLVHPGGAANVIDAAYRFVRHEPGVDVVLFGTGDTAHLHTNIASILKPPLPAADHDKLAELFGHLVGVGLDAPHLTRAGKVA
ncbi:MAG TPA: aldo/keto reductase [Stellaceae bacterium]|jgi:aryl-alcohol dehydrogenase-like predicted oxidoreductase|nr:aldo/keto reductase [Stellaceae bacterium]